MKKIILLSSYSDLQYSEDISKFVANFLKQIVKKRGQKLILGENILDKIMSYNFAFITFLIGSSKIAKNCD